jgi:hypothetical protein
MDPATQEFALPVELGFDTMNAFLHGDRAVPFPVIRGEGECAV